VTLVTIVSATTVVCIPMRTVAVLLLLLLLLWRLMTLVKCRRRSVALGVLRHLARDSGGVVPANGATVGQCTWTTCAEIARRRGGALGLGLGHGRHLCRHMHATTHMSTRVGLVSTGTSSFQAQRHWRVAR